MSAYTLQHYFGHNYMATGWRILQSSEDDPIDRVSLGGLASCSIMDWEELRGTPVNTNTFQYKQAKKRAEWDDYYQEVRRLRELEEEELDGY